MKIHQNAALTMSSAEYLTKAREYEQRGLMELAKSARATAKRLQQQKR